MLNLLHLEIIKRLELHLQVDFPKFFSDVYVPLLHFLTFAGVHSDYNLLLKPAQGHALKQRPDNLRSLLHDHDARNDRINK